MSPFFPLGISRIRHASKSSLLGHVINHLLTKLVRSRWLNIVHFCIFIDQDEAVLWGPWRLTFVLGRLENLSFFIEIICWAHLISQVPEYWAAFNFLWAQPCKRKAGSIKTQISSHLNLTPGQWSIFITILWLNLRAGKMKQILCSEWLLKWAN